MWKIPLFDLNYDKEEESAVLNVLNSKWLSIGEKTKEFESKFSLYLGGNVFSTAVSNATAALHISLIISGVKNGDEVIVPGLTFVADANVVVMCGAKPVLYDVNSLNNWNANINDIKSKVTSKTKAIIVVHFAGYPIEDIQELSLFCKQNNIILIEDVAHAIGASYKNQKCGTFGDISCFSFFANKNLSTGEGGMVVVKDKNFDSEAKLVRSHGMTSMTIDRHQGKAISYDVVRPGLNYRIDEIRSALGIIQLSKLDISNEQRHKLVNYYITKIKNNLSDVVVPFDNISKHSVSSYHIFPILLPDSIDRVSLIEKMKNDGIQTSIHYPSFNDFSYYSTMGINRPEVSEEISQRVITLPLYPTMTFNDADFIVNSMQEFFYE